MGSKVKDDIPVLTDHIKAAWNDREAGTTFMKPLRREPALIAVSVA